MAWLIFDEVSSVLIVRSKSLDPSHFCTLFNSDLQIDIIYNLIIFWVLDGGEFRGELFGFQFMAGIKGMELITKPGLVLQIRL